MTKFKQLWVTVLILLMSACLFAGDEPAKKDTAKGDKAQTKTTKKAAPVAGMVAQIDEDGNLVADPKLSPEVQNALADMINTSSEGLVEQRLPDGTVIVDLQGRFQSAVVAHIGADGKIHTNCVSSAPGHTHSETEKPGTRGGRKAQTKPDQSRETEDKN